VVIKREKYYTKKFKKDYFDKYNSGIQQCKQTSYWLFGLIPLYIKTEVIAGDYMTD
jgi:hypothetical protein